MTEKRIWGASRGEKGSISDPVNELIKQNRADSERRRLERQDSTEDLKSKVEKQKLEAELKGEEKEKMAQMEKEKAEQAQKITELQKEIGQKEIEKVRVELGGKVDQLKQSIESGASKKSIAEQVTEIKQVATDMGLGGSKIAEIQEMVALVEKLRPNKGLAEQVKEAKELLEPFEGKIPPGQATEVTLQLKKVDIELKKMDNELSIQLEQMKDDRDRRDKDWQLTIKKWEDEKQLQRDRLEQETSANAERTNLMKGGFNMLGRVAGKAMVEGGGGGQGIAANTARQYPLEADEGETGEFDCPGCRSKLYLAPDAVRVPCVKCGSISSFTRIKAEAQPVVKAEAPPEVAVESEESEPV